MERRAKVAEQGLESDQEANTTQVYVEHQSAIEVIDWSSEKYCP